MSENGVNRLLLIILVIGGILDVKSLECYVCTSTENSACTSSLTDVTPSTCSVTVTETTTESSDSTSSTTTASTFSSSSTADSSSTTSDDETSTTEETTSSSTTDTSSTTSETTTTTESDEVEQSLLSENEDPEVRVLRDADEEFSCYTITVIVNEETVTDRGCVVKSSAMCDSLNEERYPGLDLTTCTTCDQDRCNSSLINLSGISSLLLPFVMFLLSR